MRVAFASPLPPATSGVADYAAELLPALAEAGLELTVYFDGREPPSEALSSRFPVRPVTELASRAGESEAIVYQLGNSAPHHAGIYRTALQVPGIVVLHEYMLHHLVSALTLGAADGAAYAEELRYAAGETGWRAARRLLDTHHPLDVWRFPLFERVVDRSRGVMVHSRFAAERILASRAGAAVEVVPFPIDLETLSEPTARARRDARAELGVDDDVFLVGTFGLVTPHKRLEPTLRAFAELRRRRRSELWICGEVSPQFDLDGLLRETGGEDVRVKGRLPLAAFHAAMRACDIAVNLRHPTGGETSASLLRLLGSGVPTIATASGSFAEIPDGAVAKVPVDEHEQTLLRELLLRLSEDELLRLRLGREGRRHVVATHGIQEAARQHAAAIVRLAGRPAPRSAPAPLAPHRVEDPRLALGASVAAALVDLGRDETDEPALERLATAVSELGWSAAQIPRP